MSVKCKICDSVSLKIFDAQILGKYRVNYFKCTKCYFIQTENPYWLEEAYESPIATMDVGLLQRNIDLRNQVSPILNLLEDRAKCFLDYGGGYGVFVRLMRDKGFNFYLFDKYTENLFAKYFELKDCEVEKFTAVTAFEVFEHLKDPLIDINEMFSYSDVLVFSTEIQANSIIRNVDDWWYFAPESGQHISLYHYESLMKVGELTKSILYSNNFNLHILSKTPLVRDPFNDSGIINYGFFNRIIRSIGNRTGKVKVTPRPSLLMSDFEYYKSKYK
jgi:hypothetical protein